MKKMIGVFFKGGETFPRKRGGLQQTLGIHKTLYFPLILCQICMAGALYCTVAAGLIQEKQNQ